MDRLLQHISKLGDSFSFAFVFFSTNSLSANVESYVNLSIVVIKNVLEEFQ